MKATFPFPRFRDTNLKNNIHRNLKIPTNFEAC